MQSLSFRLARVSHSTFPMTESDKGLEDLDPLSDSALLLCLIRSVTMGADLVCRITVLTASNRIRPSRTTESDSGSETLPGAWQMSLFVFYVQMCCVTPGCHRGNSCNTLQSYVDQQVLKYNRRDEYCFLSRWEQVFAFRLAQITTECACACSPNSGLARKDEYYFLSR